MRLSGGELDDVGGQGNRRDRELLIRAIKALAIAVHRRFKVSVPGDTMTANQWQALIQEEWDNRTKAGD